MLTARWPGAPSELDAVSSTSPIIEEPLAARVSVSERVLSRILSEPPKVAPGERVSADVYEPLETPSPNRARPPGCGPQPVDNLSPPLTQVASASVSVADSTESTEALPALPRPHSSVEEVAPSDMFTDMISSERKVGDAPAAKVPQRCKVLTGIADAGMLVSDAFADTRSPSSDGCSTRSVHDVPVESMPQRMPVVPDALPHLKRFQGGAGSGSFSIPIPRNLGDEFIGPESPRFRDRCPEITGTETAQGFFRSTADVPAESTSRRLPPVTVLPPFSNPRRRDIIDVAPPFPVIPLRRSTGLIAESSAGRADFPSPLISRALDSPSMLSQPPLPTSQKNAPQPERVRLGPVSIKATLLDSTAESFGQFVEPFAFPSIADGVALELDTYFAKARVSKLQVGSEPSCKLSNLRVVSWNVSARKWCCWQRWQALLLQVFRQDPHVVCLQEVTQDFLDTLRRSMWVSGRFTISASSLNQNHDVIILVRRDIGASFTDIFLGSYMGRNCIVADLVCVNARFRIGSVHLDDDLENGYENSQERTAQLLKLLPSIDPSVDSMPEASPHFIGVILCGSFNFCSSAPENVLVESSGFSDLWPLLHRDAPGFTEDPHVNQMLARGKSLEKRLRSDRVLLRSHDNAAAVTVFIPSAINLLGTDPCEDNIWPSDHFGLNATISLPHAMHAMGNTLADVHLQQPGSNTDSASFLL